MRYQQDCDVSHGLAFVAQSNGVNPMLVLSRKVDERIAIGGNIEICIVEIRGDKVRIGITAPPDIALHRMEIANFIRRQGGTIENLIPETPQNDNP